MAILEKEFWVTVDSKSISWYEDLGYVIPRRRDKYGTTRMQRGTKILVKIEHLPLRSKVKLTKVCDDCDRKTTQYYYAITKCRENGDGKDRCVKCANRYKNENMRIPYEKSLAYTHPDLNKLLLDECIGYNLSHGSRKKENFKCNECGNIESKIVANVVRQGFSCSVCSDNMSYPEKFMISVLNQLNIDFEIHKKFEWSEGKIYDFYLRNMNIIIETHGKQHYNGGFETYGGKTLEEEQENDRLKGTLAIENGVDNYIVIDCSMSETNFIKSKILNSKLSIILKLNEIDWGMCHEFACKSLVKTICQLWNEGNSVKEIVETVNLSSGTTIRKYLKQGVELNWCNYNGQEELMKSIHNNLIKSQKSRRLKIVQLNMNWEIINEWNSIEDAATHLNINRSGIGNVCNGRGKTAGGFKWIFKENYDKYVEQVNL